MYAQVDRMIEQPLVGRRYKVECVYIPDHEFPFSFQYIGWWPVLGPEHEDREILNFPYPHRHYDFRFLNKRQFEFLTRRVSIEPFARVLQFHGRELKTEYRDVICHRIMPTYPTEMLESWEGGWYKPLQEAFKDTCLKDCLVCPHRGFPLASLPDEGNGVVTCRGHGLRWNTVTRELVTTPKGDPRGIEK